MELITVIIEIIIISKYKMNLTKYKNKMSSATIIITLAVALVIGLIVVPAIEQAHAGCERGAAANKSLLKSKGRCFKEGTF